MLSARPTFMNIIFTLKKEIRFSFMKKYGRKSSELTKKIANSNFL